MRACSCGNKVYGEDEIQCGDCKMWYHGEYPGEDKMEKKPVVWLYLAYTDENGGKQVLGVFSSAEKAMSHFDETDWRGDSNGYFRGNHPWIDMVLPYTVN